MKLPKLLVFTTLASLASLLLLGSGFVSAQVPQVINYQGRISAGGTPFTGVGQFKFALVSTDGTTTYWSNDGTSTEGSEPTASVALPIAAGLYVAPLGDTTIGGMLALPPSTFSNNGVKLRVWFNDGTNGSQQLTPDQQVVSVGYAMMAAGVPNAAITTAMIAPGAVTPDKLAADSSIPSGTIVAFAGSTAPAGWRLCDGASFDGTSPENAALFAALGLTYGGSGNNFNVPDLRGRVPAGRDNMGGTAANRLTSAGSGINGASLGAVGGAQSHTLSILEMPSHNHGGATGVAGAHNHTFGMRQDGSGGAGEPEAGNGSAQGGVTTSTAGDHIHTIPSQGGNQPHNNMQPSLVMNYIIKL